MIFKSLSPFIPGPQAPDRNLYTLKSPSSKKHLLFGKEELLTSVFIYTIKRENSFRKQIPWNNGKALVMTTFAPAGTL